MNSALRAGVYTLGKTVTGLSATNLFYVEAKHGLTGNYCIFRPINNAPGVDSGTHLNYDYVQFEFYGTDLATLETLVNNFDTIFNFTSSLSVTGYTVGEVRKVMEREPAPFGDIWQIIREYRIMTEKAR